MTSNNHHNIKSSYYETNKEESTLLNYQRVKIEQYLQHFLLQKGLLLQNLFFQTNEKSLNLIIYYYTLNFDSTLSKIRTPTTRLKLKEVQLRPYSQKNKNIQVRMLKKRINLSDILTSPEIRKNVFKEKHLKDKQLKDKEKLSEPPFNKKIDSNASIQAKKTESPQQLNKQPSSKIAV